MPESLRTKATLRGLAALYDIADRAGPDPCPRSMQLRALLWLLYTASDGRRSSYDDYWRVATEDGLESNTDNVRQYIRRTAMRIHLIGIGTSLGYEPRSQAFGEVIFRLNHKRE